MEPAYISQELDTNIKANIEAVFIEISLVHIPQLRSFLTTTAPGNPDAVLNDFRRRFDSLYTMSSNKKELKADIVQRVKVWLNKPLRYNNYTIREGIELFEGYKEELFKHNVVRLG